MAEKEAVPESILKVRKHHKEGYKHMNHALKLEEKEDSILPDFKYAVRLYGKGITEFEQGISVNLHGSGGEFEKAQRLQDKMKANMDMANSRVVDLTVNIELLENDVKLSEAKEKENKTSVGKGESSAIKPTTSSWKTVPKDKGKIERPLPANSISSSSRKPTRTTAQPYVPPTRVNKIPATRINSARSNTKKTTEGNNRSDYKTKISHLKNIDKTHANHILDEVLDQGKGVTFDDIGGMSNAKQILDEIVILPASRPELFTGLRAPARGLLLFGPPGNGKTLLAKALATEAKAVFFNISAASLTSKFIGEGEKMVRAMFAVARELQPAIIFIDEIDSLLCERKENEHEASRRLKTEFLVGFDGVISDADERILVMGATNRPWELDDAALRRMVKRVYVPLPDDETRKDIMKKMMKKQEKVSIDDHEYNRLARITNGYSGSDLAALAREAALMPIRDYTSEQLKLIPADQVRGIMTEDFVAAMKAIRPSVSQQHLGKFAEWNKSYGTLS